MKALTKKILAKLIHPAVVMLLEDMEEKGEEKWWETERFNRFSWLERWMITRKNMRLRKIKKERDDKKEAKKQYEAIMVGIINPPEPENEKISTQDIISAEIRKNKIEMMKAMSMYESSPIKQKE